MLILNLKERLALGSILPKEGNFLTMGVCKSITDKFNFSNEERQEITTLQVEEKLDDSVDDFKKSVKLDKAEIDLLKGQVKSLNDSSKISWQTLTLCTKISDLSWKE